MYIYVHSGIYPMKKNSNLKTARGIDALRSHLFVLLLASPTAAFSARVNSILRSIPWLKSANFLLFPHISHVSGVRYLLTHAPATITTQNEIIRYPGRLDFAESSISFVTAIWPRTLPSFPLAAEIPWQVQRYRVGKASAGRMNVVVFGPGLS